MIAGLAAMKNPRPSRTTKGRALLEKPCPVDEPGRASFLLPKSSGGDSRRQKQPVFRQHFLKRLPEPHGHRSFRPTFSTSSLLPWTIRTPRFTCVSDGKPRRRLLIGWKKWQVFEFLLVHDPPLSFVKWTGTVPTLRQPVRCQGSAWLRARRQRREPQPDGERRPGERRVQLWQPTQSGTLSC